MGPISWSWRRVTEVNVAITTEDLLLSCVTSSQEQKWKNLNRSYKEQLQILDADETYRHFCNFQKNSMFFYFAK